MYICVCRQITEDQVYDAIDNGVETFEQLKEKLPVCTCCQKCYHILQDIIAEEAIIEDD